MLTFQCLRDLRAVLKDFKGLPVFNFSWLKAMESSRQSPSYHIQNTNVAIGEDDGIWRCGNRQHEGKGGTEGSRHHHVERMDLDRCSLQSDGSNPTLEVFHRESTKNISPGALRHRLASSPIIYKHPHVLKDNFALFLSHHT